MCEIRPSDRGSGLFGSHVDLNDIAKGFSNFWSTEVSLGPDTLVTRIGKGFGFCSVIVLIDADWVGEVVPSDIPKQFIVKIPAYLDAIDEMITTDTIDKTAEEIEEEKIDWDEWVKKSTNHEITFYEWSEKYKLEIPIPKLVAFMRFNNSANIMKGFIAMDYCPGESALSRFDYLSVEEMEQVMRGFARLHSGCMRITSAEDRALCKADGNCKPDEDAMNELMMFRDMGVSDELMNELEAILPDLISRRDEIFNEANRGVTPILIQSDAWSANVLMSGEGFGNRTFAKFIDFQYVHICNPVEDLIQIITTCLALDLRKKNSTRLLRIYYDEMKDCADDMPCTFEQLQYSYEMLFVYYAINVLFLYRKHQCEGDPWKLQRAKEKIEGILEEMLAYYKNCLVHKRCTSTVL